MVAAKWQKIRASRAYQIQLRQQGKEQLHRAQPQHWKLIAGWLMARRRQRLALCHCRQPLGNGRDLLRRHGKLFGAVV